MCEYGFAENTDFVLVRQKCPTNNPNKNVKVQNEGGPLGFLMLKFEQRLLGRVGADCTPCSRKSVDFRKHPVVPFDPKEYIR